MRLPSPLVGEGQAAQRPGRGGAAQIQMMNAATSTTATYFSP
jgi:hypothetical protein